MIFYFSGTGNTRWAAEQLAAATHERLLSIADELNTPCDYTLAEQERIGFCFPVHGWQPPHIVREFISRMTIHGAAGHYAYALCTCGDSTGLAVKMLTKELALKGIGLQSCQSLIMPESYVCLPFMYTDSPEREREKTEQARHDLDEFIKVVINRQSGYSRLKRGLTPWTFSHVIGAYFNRYMITDKKFTVDAEACIHCGRCAKECPVGEIAFEETPSWKHDGRCTCCLSCYHHCPVHAINYGQITRKRGQYYFGHK
ncbi:MAG: EFR1 family ferrodoxin [Prevotella sp.]|nr:EFR1 family ferrodoxin [Prevotella sp.]